MKDHATNPIGFADLTSLAWLQTVKLTVSTLETPNRNPLKSSSNNMATWRRSSISSQPSSSSDDNSSSNEESSVDNLFSCRKPVAAYQASEEKPPHPVGCLAALAIAQSPNRSLSPAGIYSWIKANFPYYRNSKSHAWKGAVRHSLAHNSCFIRGPCKESANSDSAKCRASAPWMFAPDQKASMLNRLRKIGNTRPVTKPKKLRQSNKKGAAKRATSSTKGKPYDRPVRSTSFSSDSDLFAELSENPAFLDDALLPSHLELSNTFSDSNSDTSSEHSFASSSFELPQRNTERLLPSMVGHNDTMSGCLDAFEGLRFDLSMSEPGTGIPPSQSDMVFPALSLTELERTVDDYLCNSPPSVVTDTDNPAVLAFMDSDTLGSLC